VGYNLSRFNSPKEELTMAAAIDTTATTLEGQLVEIALAMESAEKAMPEATRVNRVTVNVDVERGTLSISSQLETEIDGAGGTIEVSAVAYLP
jgi:uncharacterized protein YqgV (UPF0045/DUF77 family)